MTVAEVRLQQLHKEMEYKERQILRASEELQQLEETASQKRVSVFFKQPRSAEKHNTTFQTLRRIGYNDYMDFRSVPVPKKFSQVNLFI